MFVLDDLDVSMTGRATPAAGFWVAASEQHRFESLNWSNMDAFLQATYPGVISRRRDEVNGWDNVRVTLPETAEVSECSSFMKRHRAGGKAAWAGWEEAQAAKLCAAAGVPCLDVLAVGVTHDPIIALDGRTFSSLFLSGLVGEGLNAFDAIARIPDDEQRADRTLAIVDAVAAATARLHSASLFHGDCHFQHFILEHADRETCQLRMIDLQQVQRVSLDDALYLWVKDMGQLRFSMLKLGFYQQHASFWYERYHHHLDSPQLRSWLTGWRRRLIDLRGDIRLFRAAGLRLGKLQFRKATEILSHRFRAA